MRVVGREREKETLREALASDEAELVAVYGRRRVGKTFLVREFFASQVVFELIGMHGVDRETQLRGFASALARASRGGERSRRRRPEAPRDWPAAFDALIAWLEPRLARSRRKRVIFLDELPWLAGRRSGFLSAFEHFWNGWASRRADLVVVICGSAASWMIQRVVRQRGGLHNRVTRTIRLEPFTLGEAEAYLRARRVRLDRHSLLELYMAMGGIPHYLKQVRRGESVAQCIERVCFARDGLLRREFEHLYASLFERAERHEEVVRALARRRGGMTRQELIAATSLRSGGGLTKVLGELLESGFLAKSPQLGRPVKDARYRLADPYSRFFLTWIEGHRGRAAATWQKKRGRARFRAWTGLTFEAVCLEHVRGIKRALGIEAVDTVDAAWLHRPRGGDGGAQVDLVIDRADRAVNLCEIKFCEDEFALDARTARDLERRRRIFARVTRTRKTVLLTLVTTHGLRDSDHARRLGLGAVTMDALFDV